MERISLIQVTYCIILVTCLHLLQDGEHHREEGEWVYPAAAGAEELGEHLQQDRRGPAARHHVQRELHTHQLQVRHLSIIRRFKQSRRKLVESTY